MSKGVIVNGSQQSIVEVMLEFVRASVLERDPIIVYEKNIDWDILMHMSAEQGLLAWVWDGICKLPVELHPLRQQRINWGLSYQEICDTYDQQKSVLNKMVKACEKHDVKILVFKGMSFSVAYPNSSFRPAGDIDIFLFGDYNKGNAILANNNLERENSKCSEFSYQGVKIENHRHFFPNTYKKYAVIEEYLNSKLSEVERTSDGYYVFTCLANLVIGVVHAVTHLVNTTDPLLIRSVLDIAMILKNDESGFTPSQCKALMTQLGIDRSFDLLVRASEWILNTDLSKYYIKEISITDVDSFKELLVRRSWPIIDNDGAKLEKIRQYRKRYQMMRWADQYRVCSTKERLVFQFKKQMKILFQDIWS